jgi:hypothetical protein
MPSAALASLSLENGEWRVLGQGSQSQYLSAGYLVYHAPHVREGQLDAVAFDVKTLDRTGRTRVGARWRVSEPPTEAPRSLQ